MKILNVIFFYVVIMGCSNAQTQINLVRIDSSNFFTNKKQVFYVVSNKYNSSGVLGELVKGVNELKISENRSNKMFDDNAQIITKELFIRTFDKGIQYTFAIEIPDVTFNKFKLIDKNYGTHKKQIFYKYHKIENSDSKSFTVILDSYHEALSKDKDYVFYKDNIIEKANPKTFKILKDKFAKDDTYVFNRGAIIKDADPKAFEIIDPYQKDRNHIWVFGRLTDIDVKSFEILEYSYPNTITKNKSLYAKDKSFVYFQGRVMPKADAKTFSIECSAAPYQTYGIDKYHVYYNNEIIPNVDLKTFAINKDKTSTKNYDASDKNYTYNRAKATKRD